MVTLRKRILRQLREPAATAYREVEMYASARTCDPPAMAPAAPVFAKAAQLMYFAVDISRWAGSIGASSSSSITISSSSSGGGGGSSGGAGISAGSSGSGGASSGGHGGHRSGDGCGGGLAGSGSCGSEASGAGAGSGRVQTGPGKQAASTAAAAAGHEHVDMDVGLGTGSRAAAVPANTGSPRLDGPGLPRLQLLMLYGARQRMLPVTRLLLPARPQGPRVQCRRATVSFAAGLWAAAMPVAAVLSLRLGRGCVDATALADGGLAAAAAAAAAAATSGNGGSGGGSGSGTEGARGSEGRAGADSDVGGAGGGGGGGTAAWLSSRRRVLLEEWRVVELVGCALEHLVPALVDHALEKVHCELLQSLAACLCTVALAFPEEVWLQARGSGTGPQGQRQVQGAGSSGAGSSRKSSGKRGMQAPASTAVWRWPTAKVMQLRKLLQEQLDLGLSVVQPELRVLSRLLELGGSGGLILPYKYDMPFVKAALELQGDPSVDGSYRWWGGEVPSPELLDWLLRACSYPACVSLDGDSEAAVEGRLVACGRGCGRAWYCCRACAEAHCREGHAEACGGGARAWQGQAAAALRAEVGRRSGENFCRVDTTI